MKYKNDQNPLSLFLIKQPLHFMIVNASVHSSLLGSLLGHGKVVLLSKPLAATVDNLDLLHRLVTAGGLVILDLPDNIHAPDHLPKHHVSPVQPAGRLGCDEELRAIGILPRVGH